VDNWLESSRRDQLISYWDFETFESTLYIHGDGPEQACTGEFKEEQEVAVLEVSGYMATCKLPPFSQYVFAIQRTKVDL
jgi:hypothetical protein